MAQTKVKDGSATETAAQPKQGRRRITRRKAVEEHARAYFEALAARDPDAMAERWSEEAVADFVPLGIRRGRDEIVGVFRELLAAVPDLETAVTCVVAGERQAAVEWRMSGHFTGAPLHGVEATGRRIDLRGCDLLEIEDGTIASATVLWDGMSLARQIGSLPPQDSGAERAFKSVFNTATKLRRRVTESRNGR
jgi:steroid delta-isomerase-like uncharacterized protein